MGEEMSKGGMHMNEESPKQTKVRVKEGDIIEIKRALYKGKKGTVLIVRENSVIAQLGYNKNTGEPIKTVVNHKNYKKVR
jgi:Uncharacterized protein conserved in bacteria (DUF2187).